MSTTPSKITAKLKFGGTSNYAALENKPKINGQELEAGDNTVVDAEVVDIRTGYDGTEYDSAGNAVRSQVSALNVGLTNEVTNRTNADAEIVSAFNKSLAEETANRTNADTSIVSQFNADLSTEITNRTNADSAITEVTNALTDKTSELEKLKAEKESLAATNKRLKVLWSLLQDEYYNLSYDSEDAYRKSIPTNGKALTMQSMGGRSVVWNQQIADDYTTCARGNSGTTSGVSYSVSSDGYLTLSGTTTAGFNFIFCQVAMYSNHIYYCIGTDSVTNLIALIYDTVNKTIIKRGFDDGELFSLSNTATDARIYLNYGSSGAEVSYKGAPKLFDLTQMFGVTSVDSVTDEMKAFCESYASANPDYNSGEVLHADVTEVDSIWTVDNVEHEVIAKIPSALRELDGYGWGIGSVYNEIDFARKKYIKRIGRVDLVTLAWNYTSTATAFSTSIPTRAYGAGNFNLLTSAYPTYTQAHSTLSNMEEGGALHDIDKSLFVNGGSRTFYIRDTSYTDAVTFRTAMSGVYLYYELADYVETDITDLLLLEDISEPILCEDGGYMEFVQTDTEIPIPNEEEFVIKI